MGKTTEEMGMTAISQTRETDEFGENNWGGELQGENGVRDIQER